MGSDAAVYPFDYNLCVNRVVPAIQAFMLTGKADDWLSLVVAVSEARGPRFDYIDYWENTLPALRKFLQTGETDTKLSAAIAQSQCLVTSKNGTDLARYCTFLKPDLAWNAAYDWSDTWRAHWPQRACLSQTCPEKDRCPFHSSQQAAIAESWTSIIRDSVSLCLDRGMFVGRSANTFRIWNVLTNLFGIDEEHPLHGLLLKLGKRGYAVGYVSGSVLNSPKGSF